MVDLSPGSPNVFGIYRIKHPLVPAIQYTQTQNLIKFIEEIHLTGLQNGYQNIGFSLNDYIMIKLGIITF